MDLKSGYPYWAVKNGLMCAFPALERDLRCEIAIVGGGITGALIADELARHGHDVAVLEQRDVGWGSTAASTALLQYEIDTHMVDLAKRYDEDTALLAYRSCVEAILLIQDLARKLRDVDFGRMSSLYYASRRWHRLALRREFEMRQRHGFDVEWLDRDDIRERFEFEAPAAILSAMAARVDPYRMACRLFTRMCRGGSRVFDRTRIIDMQTTTRGVVLHTERGCQVRATHVVLAGGYANQQWLKHEVARNRSSYAFITDPLAEGSLCKLRETMVWESARPYLYLRCTGDGRLLVGGEDDAVDIPSRRDACVESKARRLARKVERLFPHLDMTPAYSWAGTFAETEDGLPYFGPHPQLGPRVHFAMAYGGNGITYSMLGAGLIRALVERRPHPLQALFSFARTQS